MLAAISAAHPRLARLWQLPACLVVAARERALPQFALAAARSRDRGWPVMCRPTGGLAVPQGPGVINLSLGWTLCPVDSTTAYRLLGSVIVQALARLDVDARLGCVPGAICPGSADIVLDDRKVGGTAQRWGRQQFGGRAALVHANLFVDGPLVQGSDAVNAYYADLGLADRFDASRLIALSERSPTVSTQRLSAVIGAALDDHGFAHANAERLGNRPELASAVIAPAVAGRAGA